MKRVALIGTAAIALAGCGGADSDTDAPGGTARASALTECLKKVNLNTRMIDNKAGSARAFSVVRENGKITTYAYVFENPGKARSAQRQIFKPKDKETVAAYTVGDTVVVNTHAAADAQPELTNCFEQEAGSSNPEGSTGN